MLPKTLNKFNKKIFKTIDLDKKTLFLLSSGLYSLLGGIMGKIKKDLIKLALTALILTANFPSSAKAQAYQPANYTSEIMTSDSGMLYREYHRDYSDMYNSDQSSYQGTTTGPGPNGGYPGAPRGSYKTNYSQAFR